MKNGLGIFDNGKSANLIHRVSNVALNIKTHLLKSSSSYRKFLTVCCSAGFLYVYWIHSTTI